MKAAVEASTGEARRPRVLLVEDDPDLVVSLASLLTEHDYDVASSPDGRRALERLATSPLPDVIVLDLMMPVMNGWEFRAAQRADPGIADIPVVAITADSSAQAAAIHAERVLRKPFGEGELLVAVERVLLARERRKMMARLEQTERLAALGTIAAGVAHEVGNPLSYVIGNLGLAEEELPRLRDGLLALAPLLPEGEEAERTARQLAGLAGDVATWLHEARAGSERVRLIVRNLLGLARRAEDRRAAVELPVLLEEAISLAWNQIRYRAKLVRRFEPTPPLHANGPQLVQVFVNLLVNAAHAIPEGDREANEVEIRTRAPDVDEKGGGPFAVVEVRDTGSGMSRGVVGRIFEPFFTTRGEGEGTGLGLWICHETVVAHGGRIEVESQVGEGSLFRIWLPAGGIAARAPETVVAPAPAPAPPRAHVWIVDDEPVVAQTLARVLKLHHDVLVAHGGGHEVLDRLARGERYDILLCDLMMPEMTGMELMAAIEDRHPDLAERVLFVTGGAFTAEARAFVERYASRLVEKPFDISVLRQRVAEMTNRA